MSLYCVCVHVCVGVCLHNYIPKKKSWDVGVLILNTSNIPDVACVHLTVVLCPPAAVKLDTFSLPLKGNKIHIRRFKVGG